MPDESEVWEPTVAELRDGEVPDLDSHASVNLALRERAEELLDREVRA